MKNIFELLNGLGVGRQELLKIFRSDSLLCRKRRGQRALRLDEALQLYRLLQEKCVERGVDCPNFTEIGWHNQREEQ